MRYPNEILCVPFGKITEAAIEGIHNRMYVSSQTVRTVGIGKKIFIIGEICRNSRPRFIVILVICIT